MFLRLKRGESVSLKSLINGIPLHSIKEFMTEQSDFPESYNISANY